MEVRQAEDANEQPLLGTCLEGIRVEFNTPGFNHYPIVALANAEGLNAPKTNVARSGLEATPERDNMLTVVYSLFCRHIEREIEELHTKRSFSLTWAVQESKFLSTPLMPPRGSSAATNNILLIDEIKRLPVLLIERDGIRSAISPFSLQEEEVFWTIDCASFRSAEDLIRELPGNASLSLLVRTLNSESFQIPKAPLLCGTEPESLPDSFAYSGKEVASILVDKANRRVDLKWAAKTDAPRWRSFPIGADYDRSRVLGRSDRRSNETLRQLYVGEGDVEISGLSNEIAIRTFGQTYLIPGSKIATTLVAWLNKLNRDASADSFDKTVFVFLLVGAFLQGRLRVPVDARTLTLQVAPEKRWGDEVISPELIEILNTTNWKVFDPSAWVRAIDEDENLWFE